MITTQLTEEAAAKLAAAYSDADFMAANQNAVQGLYPPASVITDAVLDGFWSKKPLLHRRDREIAVLSTLVATGGSAANVGIHCYVAIAARVSVSDLADILTLVGSYSGVQRLMDNLRVLSTTLTVLQAQADAGKVGVMDVVPALQKALS